MLAAEHVYAAHIGPCYTGALGTQVIQKLFEHGTQAQKTVLANTIEGNVLYLSCNLYGCRVVQKAIETMLPEQRSSFVWEREPRILRCVMDSNGNHVVQKIIEHVSADHLGFISAFSGYVFDLASHPFGCRVLQQCIEHPPNVQMGTLYLPSVGLRTGTTFSASTTRTSVFTRSDQLQWQPDALANYDDRHGDVRSHAELAFVPWARDTHSTSSSSDSDRDTGTGMGTHTRPGGGSTTPATMPWLFATCSPAVLTSRTVGPLIGHIYLHVLPAHLGVPRRITPHAVPAISELAYRIAPEEMGDIPSEMGSSLVMFRHHSLIHPPLASLSVLVCLCFRTRLAQHISCSLIPMLLPSVICLFVLRRRSEQCSSCSSGWGIPQSPMVSSQLFTPSAPVTLAEKKLEMQLHHTRSSLTQNKHTLHLTLALTHTHTAPICSAGVRSTSTMLWPAQSTSDTGDYMSASALSDSGSRRSGNRHALPSILPSASSLDARSMTHTVTANLPPRTPTNSANPVCPLPLRLRPRACPAPAPVCTTPHSARSNTPPSTKNRASRRNHAPSPGRRTVPVTIALRIRVSVRVPVTPPNANADAADPNVPHTLAFPALPHPHPPRCGWVEHGPRVCTRSSTGWGLAAACGRRAAVAVRGPCASEDKGEEGEALVSRQEADSSDSDSDSDDELDGVDGDGGAGWGAAATKGEEPAAGAAGHGDAAGFAEVAGGCGGGVEAVVGCRV
ncbi:hypothetical protein B0H14DRAFT_3451430 [Mycena olivaceomarginata]|nr:hypothetical protein B0H14DRAFT_3451430 [Mycena olivaceomarginata]